jgi:Tol biopolymer transport system component
MTQCGYLCGDVGGLFRPPNGDRILLAVHDPGGRDPGEADPYVAVSDPDGTDVEILVDRSWMIENGFNGAEMDAPSWSPDATRILVRLGFNGPAPKSLWPAFVMDADGSDIQRLDGYGPWSPDSSSIAFVDGQDDGEPGGRITIVDVETGTERTIDVSHHPAISECPGIGCGLSWSPDGRSLLVSAPWPDIAPVGEEVTVDIETGDTTELQWAIDGLTSWQRVAAD